MLPKFPAGAGRIPTVPPPPTGGAGGIPATRAFAFFVENPTAEPLNLQELANKLFSIYVTEFGLSFTDAEVVIRAYAARYRAEVSAADFADKLGNCVVEMGGRSSH